MTATLEPTQTDREAAQRAYDLDRKHVFHSWSAQDTLDPMVISAAEGSHLWDGEGNKYLDFSSQLVNTNIGHQHPAVVAAIAAQAAKLCTIAPSYVNDARSEAARLIAERTPGGELDRIFFTNGGADANEHAVRMARLHTGRHKVLSAYRSYHGGTHLAVNITGDPRRWASDNGSAGTIHFFPPYLYRTAFHSTTEEQEARGHWSTWNSSSSSKVRPASLRSCWRASPPERRASTFLRPDTCKAFGSCAPSTASSS